MAVAEEARVFMSGRSQAMRIPAEFPFFSKEVYVRRDAQSGDLILSESLGGNFRGSRRVWRSGRFPHRPGSSPAAGAAIALDARVVVRYLLDTNMVSYIARGLSKAARTRLARLKNGQIPCISAITEAEIRYGLARNPSAHALQRAMEGFLAPVKVLSWGREEARAYRELRAKLELQGETLSILDMFIAAHAVAEDAVLVTGDGAFAVAAELRGIENWAVESKIELWMCRRFPP